jgi:hypothetical protein
MNIKHAFLVTLIGTSIVAPTNLIAYSQIIDDEQQEENYFESYDEEQPDNWFESCAAPYIAGAAIGLVSGKISAMIFKASLTITATALMITENKTKQSIIGLAGLSAIIGTLVAENKLRVKCVDWVNKKLENSGIESHNLIKNSARIPSWIGFLFL